MKSICDERTWLLWLLLLLLLFVFSDECVGDKVYTLHFLGVVSIGGDR